MFEVEKEKEKEKEKDIMPIPVIIVTGFLGCGKTSFLRHLLPRCGVAGLRPALIINEVGDVDVDGELLADLQAEQARLVGGCVCCTLQSQSAARCMSCWSGRCVMSSSSNAAGYPIRWMC